MSKRHPSSRRHGHTTSDTEDAFVARTLEMSRWAQQNTRLLVVTGVVLVAVVWAAVYYVNYRGSLEEQAVLELEQIHQTVALGDREAAKQELGRFLTDFGDTDHAGEARLLLGELYLRTGQPAQAISALEPLTKSLRSPLAVQGGFLLAAAYEEEGRWDDAERLYLSIADRADLQFQVREALDDAARVHQRQGDLAAAADLYRRAIETFEEGEQGRSYYEMRLAEITAAQEG